MLNKMEYDLTIITVCFNALDKLERTVDSVLEHKARYPLEVEHLIVDGASTDGTPEALALWQLEGKIESYVSEPDAGIYDAMNKGIRLARGKVLYFLNADDTLTGENLTACVEPILRGEVQHSAAPANIMEAGQIWVQYPHFEFVYLQTPCCHQGYFASTELYRTLGGYNQTQYRCIADADFMCRAYSAVGLPAVHDKPVADYPNNGFSRNCGYMFLPEFIKLLDSGWADVSARCKVDSAYEELISLVLLRFIHTLCRWMAEYGVKDSCVDELLVCVQTHYELVRNMKQKLLLYCAMQFCLKPLLNRGTLPAWREKWSMWAALAAGLSRNNPYADPFCYPCATFGKALFSALKKRCMLVPFFRHIRS